MRQESSLTSPCPDILARARPTRARDMTLARVREPTFDLMSKIRIDDLGRFLKISHHEATLTGTVTSELFGEVVGQCDRVGDLDGEQEIVRDTLGIELHCLRVGQLGPLGKQTPKPLVDLDSIKKPRVVGEVIIGRVVLIPVIDQPLPRIVFPRTGPDSQIRLILLGNS